MEDYFQKDEEDLMSSRQPTLPSAADQMAGKGTAKVREKTSGGIQWNV
jgi:hypothetical protein